MGDERLKVSDVDLEDLSMALDDQDLEHEWWFDPATGAVVLRMDEALSGIEDDRDYSDMVDIEASRSSGTAYRDMVDFAEAVADTRARDRLLRALEGKGAFRRFRDTLYDFDELGSKWRDFSKLNDEGRALEWLGVHDLVDATELEAAIDDRREQSTQLLVELAADGGPTFTTDEVPGRWTELVEHLDAGRSVTITRDGRPWAQLQPTT